MHDWTLVSLSVDWAKGSAFVSFRNEESKEAVLIAEGLTLLHMPRHQEWGASVSVNAVSGPALLANGNYFFEIEMQSGDRIRLEADSISLPLSEKK